MITPQRDLREVHRIGKYYSVQMKPRAQRVIFAFKQRVYDHTAIGFRPTWAQVKVDLR